MDQVLNCKAATQGGDQILAINFMDEAVICHGQNGLEILLATHGIKAPDLIAAKEIIHVGATSYR